MKTADAIKVALSKYQTDLDNANAKKHQLEEYLEQLRGWSYAGGTMTAEEFLATQVKEKGDVKEQIAKLEKDLSELKFKVKFAKWVLEEKEATNE